MRCAIYTRKSADERADTRLGSIERQRELCEAYVAIQAGEGWYALAEHYDDPGYSGGTLRRPALQRLLADIEAGAIDIVLVYKIDRLSRSLRDFLDLVASFERRATRFVAITQHFDTVSSTGRLMLNILLSFAQFERELTSERLKDWFAGARARGLWTQGLPPYGYDVRDLRLIVNPGQAEMVRYIFRRYPALGSSRLLAAELNAGGHLNKMGRPFNSRLVITILSNRLYRGDLPHRGGILPGQHEALVSEAVFRRARAVMAETGRRRRARRPIPASSSIRGLVSDGAGRTLVFHYVRRRGRLYRYFLPRYHPGVVVPPALRFRAADLEAAVVAVLARVAGPPPHVRDDAHMTAHVRRMVARIVVLTSEMHITLTTGATISAAHSAATSAARADPAGGDGVDGG